MSRKIETKEQYKASLDWMVEKAKQLEHPLLDEEGRLKLEQQYDYVSMKIDEYKERKYNPDLEFWGIDEELKRLGDKEEPQKKQINLGDFVD